MPKFSDQQFKTFRQLKRNGFYEKLHLDLRGFMARKLPDVALEDGDARIRQAFQTCADHGFRTEKQITTLSYILVTFPRDYAQSERFGWLDALIRAKATPGVRLSRIKAVIKAGAS
ncbi:hypothetical protein HKX54_15415 [Sulfitobacter sp. M57]|uniref:hypothetical protein n=1 Tax=unclassified Sulfitobacter TaxID=196795 RepID=UPI0023E2D7BC|nr:MULTISPECIES: hypothetical protein [unclassified Sulfitobacter]MDF3415856.1 hypothetical protein [Sulfitobacter sp. KE5]MDF3423336.1 hypothetical protein [Sulfitobacter sp. KE43]MDF3434402.1 hypothetical protein [Sulfitobacter sp. KE42]MDF3460042.1 hypothetical protein [Sulfitobacter sp. S74]MDF3463940.1 hypothetical protein [Sulfitobacter sp. Ks18]